MFFGRRHRLEQPATQNQLRAERLVEAMMADRKMGPLVHGFAYEMFGDIKPLGSTIAGYRILEARLAGVEKEVGLRSEGK